MTKHNTALNTASPDTTQPRTEPMTYDPESIRNHYDAYGTREWDRLSTTLHGRIKYAIHRQILMGQVAPGMRVLDVGCGPGRFAIDLVEAGGTVTLADISQTQLDLALKHLAEAGLGGRIAGCYRADVVDLHPFQDAQFDLVVCYGGAVSYTYDRHPGALSELTRVVRPGGSVLLSVMSLYGCLRLIGPLDAADFLDCAATHIDWAGILEGNQVILSTPGSNEFHQPMALFTSAGLRCALGEAGLRTRVLATSNPLIPEFASLPRIEESQEASNALRDAEIALCTQPGLLDAGEHLIAVTTKGDQDRTGSR